MEYQRKRFLIWKQYGISTGFLVFVKPLIIDYTYYPFTCYYLIYIFMHHSTKVTRLSPRGSSPREKPNFTSTSLYYNNEANIIEKSDEGLRLSTKKNMSEAVK